MQPEFKLIQWRTMSLISPKWKNAMKTCILCNSYTWHIIAESSGADTFTPTVYTSFSFYNRVFFFWKSCLRDFYTNLLSFTFKAHKFTCSVAQFSHCKKTMGLYLNNREVYECLWNFIRVIHTLNKRKL